MSYDYTLFLAPGPGPMSTWEPVPPASLGSVEEVLARLKGVFPAAGFTQEPGTSACFGHAEPIELGRGGGIEFQMTPEADGTVRFLTVRRIARDEVATLCRILGLVAVDNQTVDLIRP
jgi:hypothetical protein